MISSQCSVISDVTKSQRSLDPFAVFIENSQAVQGQTPARQNSRGKAKTELNTRQEVRAGGKQSQFNKHNPSRGRQQTIRITSKQSKVR